MEGTQFNIAAALRRLLESVEGNRYGSDDDFDTDAFREDVDEELLDLLED